MVKIILLIVLLGPLLAKAQNGILILKKKSKFIHVFQTGEELDMETVYQQRFKGTITAIRHDSVFLDGQPWHFREIAAIHQVRLWSGLLLLGSALLITGGGILALETTFGLTQGESIAQWYSTSGLLAAGSLLVSGFFIRRAYSPNYRIGRKFRLEVLELGKSAH
jgi:hypothetical protein